MKAFTIQLMRHELVAEQTMAFHFERPAGFHFQAGQTVDLTLIDPPSTDAEGDSRTFSIASAPGEVDLLIATRMRSSAFKRILASVPLGTRVQAEGPAGSFTLHDNAAITAVFLTGGIGITPFRSIVSDAIARRLGHTLWLFYSNNRPQDAAFLDDLQKVARENPTFHFVPTMTKIEDGNESWQGETGVVDRAMLNRHLSDLQRAVYYIAGPPAMVSAMREMLRAASVKDDDVRWEGFDGY